MEGQMTTQQVDVSETRAKLYEAVLHKAQAAQTCKVKHHCPRYQHMMGTFLGGPTQECEVWDRLPSLNGEVVDDSQPEQVFLGTRKECDDYIVNATRGAIGADRYYTEEPGRCTVCDAFDNRKARTAKGVMPPFLVVAWGVSRHYGGPQEGGWWYDWTTILEVRKVHTFEAAYQAMWELKTEYPQPRFNRYSCANRGEDDVRIGAFYGESDPRFPQESTERPHYE
jgi:hypothetical protein